MNRRIVLAGAIMFGFIVLDIFALSELPEPEFIEPAKLSRIEASVAPVFEFPDFHQTVFDLWNINPAPGSISFDFISIAAYAESASSDALPDIPQNIRNNRYFIESVRLTNLAQENYEYGDYDASVQYAEEALKYARLSDEYVALQLKIKEADEAIKTARTRITWAASVDAATRYPREYGEAQTLFTSANTSRTAKDWDGAIYSARRVIEVLANVTEAPPPTLVTPVPETPALPAQYTVRSWSVSKDCFWNIAGRSWAYGDPTKWRLIYNANKAKLPQPDNPDLIHPGMILDIPSINGEHRQGMWDASRTYNPLR